MILAACGDDGGGGADAGTTAPSADEQAGETAEVADADAMTDQRCEANRDAGTITFLTGFDDAATASAIEVMVADARGYYEELCLDVDIRPSFSTENYPLIAANEAQFASAGSFSEVVSYAEANDADFVVTTVFGQVPIDALILKPGVAEELTDLEGATIGVKGKLTTSVAAMLAEAGLHEGENFDTVLLDGFDPTAHIAIDEIDGFPGWKSNEPGRLEREEIDFDLFDPADHDVAGSFGIVYTNGAFLDDHPEAASDFVRASLRGMADALADPDAAAQVALDRINAGDNPNFLSPEGERFRWRTDAELITDTTPDELNVGVGDPDGLQAELDQAAEFGLIEPDSAGELDTYLDTDLARNLYDADGRVLWPGPR